MMKNVLKFGGTSVGSAANMRKVAEIVCGHNARIVVLSAMSGTTDILVKIEKATMAGRKEDTANDLAFLRTKYMNCIDELLTSSRDEAACYIDNMLDRIAEAENVNEGEIQVYGELMTTFIFHRHILETGQRSVLLFSPDYMVTEKGTVDTSTLEALQGDASEEGCIYIAQGFICSTEDGRLGTLGRGGSDYSAALMGAAIGADEVQIWTDIDGMHTGDPRYVKGTRPIRTMSFDEAAEMAYFGAKILHPATIDPCRKAGIPVRLKNTMDPSAEGTLISSEDTAGTTFHAVAAKDDITLIRISSARMLMAYGFLCRIFEIFEKWRTPIDMITTSEVAVSLTIDNIEHLKDICDELGSLGTVSVEQKNTIVSIVGCMDFDHSGIAARIFRTVGDIPVKMISYGASHRSISILIDTEYKITTLQCLNNGLF